MSPSNTMQILERRTKRRLVKRTRVLSSSEKRSATTSNRSLICTLLNAVICRASRDNRKNFTKALCNLFRSHPLKVNVKLITSIWRHKQPRYSCQWTISKRNSHVMKETLNKKRSQLLRNNRKHRMIEFYSSWKNLWKSLRGSTICNRIKEPHESMRTVNHRPNIKNYIFFTYIINNIYSVKIQLINFLNFN